MKSFFKSKWTIAGIVLLALIGIYWFFHRGGTVYQFVPVTQGSITETVSVTGNTTPTQSVSLGFQNSGTITHVYYSLGDRVSAGTVIASLDTGDLSAQLAQAQADVDAQTAKLNGLKAGAQPEDIAVSEAAVKKAQQDLVNMYAGILNTSNASYSSANDAVRTQLSTFFTGSEANPQLSYQASDSQSSINAVLLRASAAEALTKWNQDITTIDTSSADALAALVQNEISYLKTVQDLLNTVSMTLNTSTNLSTTALAADKAAVTVGNTEVNASMTNLTSILQNISSQNLTVAQLQAQLALKQAGSTSTDIAAQEAQVAQAQAGVASIQAKLSDGEIVAPIDGIITQMDAKIGQVASPATPLVSIISNGQFEVDADVPETDVGKLAVGNTVAMTFDAFPNETFTGKVFYINQAETITQGVVDYKVKVSFDTPDARMKSGLTANLDIATKKDANVLILPQYAILINDTGSFVETLSAAKKVVMNPVTLGIQDENGNVEVLSGVTLGEQVLNIGLKPAGQ